MLLQRTLPAFLAIGGAIAYPQFVPSNHTIGNSTVEKIRGASIGGWLVLEPWITPSLFEPYGGEAVDEYTFTLNIPDAQAKLQQHWSTFATVDDFQRLAALGLNTVRIPIGYWAFKKLDGDPYIQGADVYLDQALEWARQTGLKVWIDLHGAPGSENGYDNSGRKLDRPRWADNATNIANTVEVLETIAQKYAAPMYQDVVSSITLLNEPALYAMESFNQTDLEAFYTSGYNAVRKVDPDGAVTVSMHDGFLPPYEWDGFMTPVHASAVRNTALDHHEYQVFDAALVNLTTVQHVRLACDSARNFTAAASLDKPLVVGEWTAAMTDCAPHLNGFGAGSRYEGTFPGPAADATNLTTLIRTPTGRSCSSFVHPARWTASFKNDMRRFVEAQLDVYERMAEGWFFWNFKTEGQAGSKEWDLLYLADAGVFPAHVGERRFKPVECAV